MLKALGTGLGTGMRWTDVEVVNRLSGRPEVRLHGQVAAAARRRQLRQVDVSLSHVSGLAMASAVVCLGADGPPDPGEGAGWRPGRDSEAVTEDRWTA